MTRPLRIQYPGAMHHIISRGIGKMTIFHNEKYWKKFIQFMDRVIERFNCKYRRVGPVLQGRYKSWLVEKEEKFLDNCRYIVNNPVEAKMIQHPSEWQWSSFRATRGLEKVPEYLEADFLLRHFSSSRKQTQSSMLTETTN